MARVRLTYEHPPGSGQPGVQRTWDESQPMESNRGQITALEVQVGDFLRVVPRYMTKVVAVESVPEE